MDQKRPAIKTTIESEAPPSTVERDTLPPSANRPAFFADRDETAGLVSVLFHAQQAALAAAQFSDAARDANDEELAAFLEDSQRENQTRVERAKRLLLARLQNEHTPATHSPIHPATHGRVHYVSTPDEPADPLSPQ